MSGENVYCVCEGPHHTWYTQYYIPSPGRTKDGETKCRKRITQGKGSSAKNQAVRIRAIRDADYKYKEGDVLHVSCLIKLGKGGGSQATDPFPAARFARGASIEEAEELGCR